MDEGDMPTPTKSEFNTFRVLANQEFVNFQKPPVDDGGIVNVLVEDAVPVSPWETENLTFVAPPPQETIPAEILVEEFEEEVPSPVQSVSTTSYDSEEAPSKIPPPRQPSRQKESTKAEIDAEKEGLLNEIHSMERQGDVKLVRPLTMNDSLEEIQFQYDRMQSEVNATQMVDFAKSAIKMGSGMLEMVLKKSGLKIVDGYHNNLCKDMNKFNRPLTRLYKKYWRRGGMSPEAELGMLVFGSLAWTVVQNKMGSFGAKEEEPAPAKASKPPPKMSALNIPSSWAESDTAEADSVRDAAADRATARERAIAEREKEAQEKERALILREQRLREDLETLGSVEEDTRKISLSGTPRRRVHKKQIRSGEVNLDS